MHRELRRQRENTTVTSRHVLVFSLSALHELSSDSPAAMLDVVDAKTRMQIVVFAFLANVFTSTLFTLRHRRPANIAKSGSQTDPPARAKGRISFRSTWFHHNNKHLVTLHTTYSPCSVATRPVPWTSTAWTPWLGLLSLRSRRGSVSPPVEAVRPRQPPLGQTSASVQSATAASAPSCRDQLPSVKTNLQLLLCTPLLAEPGKRGEPFALRWWNDSGMRVQPKTELELC